MTSTQAFERDSAGGVALLAPIPKGAETILSPEALDFVADLTRTFRPRIQSLLDARKRRQARLDKGERLDFLEETRAVREGDWKVAKLPDDLLDRRVEITGPVDRKMIINALNSGASCFMADFEDSTTPTWTNLVEGQVNLYDAVRGTISFVDEAKGKRYALVEKPAVLLVRPRGLHLPEAHLLVDGERGVGALLDFGLYLFHNAGALIEKGSGPYFYLPKLESHLEARLWNDVFVHAQKALGIPQGTIKATVLIETLPAAFEMDEILFELKDHAAGLNCGRWDYIFSFIKKHRATPAAVLPDRGDVGMTQPFMRAYTQLVIRTCHKRGAMAIGGMAAQIPIKSDEKANEAALAKVRADKEREANDGHDGTWVAHPGLVPVAREIFDRQLAGKQNQLDVLREDVKVTADDLVAMPKGDITEEGLRHNVRVGVQYLEAWLSGTGCVPLYFLMEDAATAEISRTQVWQWLHHKARTKDGKVIDAALLDRVLDEEMQRVRQEIGEARFASGRFDEARALFAQLAKAPELEEFLTLPAYERIVETGEGHARSPI